MRLSGSVKLCELGIRLVRWRRRRFARLLAAFGLALLFLFGLDATLFRRRQPGVGLQRRHRLLDLRQPFLLVAGPIRHLVAALVSAESLVLFEIRRRGGRQHASDLGFQFRLAFLHALITHRFMFRRVRFDLRAIKRDMAEFDQPCRLAQLQNLQEQRAERLQMPLAEVADRAKIRRIDPQSSQNRSVRGRPSRSGATNTARSHSRAAEAPPSSAGQTAVAQDHSHSCP